MDLVETRKWLEDKWCTTQHNNRKDKINNNCARKTRKWVRKDHMGSLSKWTKANRLSFLLDLCWSDLFIMWRKPTHISTEFTDWHKWERNNEGHPPWGCISSAHFGEHRQLNKTDTGMCSSKDWLLLLNIPLSETLFFLGNNKKKAKNKGKSDLWWIAKVWWCGCWVLHGWMYACMYVCMCVCVCVCVCVWQVNPPNPAC